MRRWHSTPPRARRCARPWLRSEIRSTAGSGRPSACSSCEGRRQPRLSPSGDRPTPEGCGAARDARGARARAREYVFSWRACRHHTNEECPGCSCPIAGSTGCSTPTCAANTRRRRDDRDPASVQNLVGTRRVHPRTKALTKVPGTFAQPLESASDSRSARRGSNPRPSAWEGAEGVSRAASLRLVRGEVRRTAAPSGVAHGTTAPGGTASWAPFAAATASSSSGNEPHRRSGTPAWAHAPLYTTADHKMGVLRCPASARSATTPTAAQSTRPSFHRPRIVRSRRFMGFPRPRFDATLGLTSQRRW